MMVAVFVILLMQVGMGLLVFGVLRGVLRGQEEARRQHLADSMAITRIEHAAEALVRVCQTEADATRAQVRGESQQMTTSLESLVSTMKAVVHETPDFAITGEDGEVPVRRMRGLRSALARMEELSRAAAGE